ncbi:hypothetical protein TorRG33x02_218860 [Trema orientale]|uniref:Uncharacterized protein n=1 Tax=Trema orientale TaxID=63057 RepID=A0A2P5E9W3_TREOI|nr:hypothetical protein TorRG33x02_218860 [Trema orientale]
MEIIVPISSKSEANHWFQANVKIVDKCVELWDSVLTNSPKKKGSADALEILQTLDALLELEIKMVFGDGFKFANFERHHIDFEPNETRLDLNLDLVSHECNEVKEQLLNYVEDFFNNFIQLDTVPASGNKKATKDIEAVVKSTSKSLFDTRFNMMK